MFAVLAVALAVAAPFGYRAWQATDPGARAADSAQRAGADRLGRGSTDPAAEGLDVQLKRLTRPGPEPTTGNRNPFQFDLGPGPRAGFEPPTKAPVAITPAPVPPAAAPPPIPLKFIGLVEGPAGTGRLAVLSDGRFVYQGREGDIIDGRYRLVRIGVESVVIEHLDGRGRQTLRLSGS